MLHCVALYRIVLCCTVLYGAELYCVALCCIVSYCVVLHCFLSYCVVLHRIVLCCVESYLAAWVVRCINDYGFSFVAKRSFQFILVQVQIRRRCSIRFLEQAEISNLSFVYWVGKFPHERKSYSLEVIQKCSVTAELEHLT